MVVRWLGAVVLVCAAILVLGGYYGHGPLGERLGFRHQVLTPSIVMTPGEGADPLVIEVGFPWSGAGYCSGQAPTAPWRL